MSMQKLNCAIGDLAIVRAAQHPDNLGQIVEVLGQQTGVPVTLTGPGHIWQVRAVSGRNTLTYVFTDTGRRVRHAVGPAPDCRLWPISGPVVDDFRQEAGALELAGPRPEGSDCPADASHTGM